MAGAVAHPDRGQSVPYFQAEAGHVPACIDKIAEDKAKGAYVDPGAGKITFRAFTDEWRREVVDLRASTLARDLGYLDRYLLPTFGDLKLRDITTPMVRAWVAQIEQHRAAPLVGRGRGPEAESPDAIPDDRGHRTRSTEKDPEGGRRGPARIASNPAHNMAGVRAPTHQSGAI